MIRALGECSVAPQEIIALSTSRTSNRTAISYTMALLMAKSSMQLLLNLCQAQACRAAISLILCFLHG